MSEINESKFVESIDDENDVSVISERDRHSYLADNDEPSQSNALADISNKLDVRSWEFRPRVAKFESEKEFAMFQLFCNSGSGRSTQYISFTYNLPESRVQKIADKNNWAKRAAEYDRYQLQLMLAAEKGVRAEEHIKKLEEYRMQQEFIGRSLSADAAKLAAIVSNTLDKFISDERELDMRDVPSILSAANKAAEIGRNLQSSSLGVDQLLVALEEYDE
jgi:hypothetical protein